MIQDFQLATHRITPQCEISTSRRMDIANWPSLDLLQWVSTHFRRDIRRVDLLGVARGYSILQRFFSISSYFFLSYLNNVSPRLLEIESPNFQGRRILSWDKTSFFTFSKFWADVWECTSLDLIDLRLLTVFYVGCLDPRSPWITFSTAPTSQMTSDR